MTLRDTVLYVSEGVAAIFLILAVFLFPLPLGINSALSVIVLIAAGLAALRPFDIKYGKLTIETQDIIPIGAVLVAIIIAISMAIRNDYPTAGVGLIVGLVGSSAAAKVIKSTQKKTQDQKKQ